MFNKRKNNKISIKSKFFEMFMFEEMCNQFIGMLENDLFSLYEDINEDMHFKVRYDEKNNCVIYLYNEDYDYKEVYVGQIGRYKLLWSIKNYTSVLEQIKYKTDIYLRLLEMKQTDEFELQCTIDGCPGIMHKYSGDYKGCMDELRGELYKLKGEPIETETSLSDGGITIKISNKGEICNYTIKHIKRSENIVQQI